MWGYRTTTHKLDLETEGFNEYVDGLNARSIILEVGGDETIAGAKGDPIMENNPLYK